MPSQFPGTPSPLPLSRAYRTIFSVSGEPNRRPEVIRMGHWLNEQLKAVGVETTLKDLGTQHVDGEEIPLPPAILGKLGNDPAKKTVLVYGHYDVQPVRVNLIDTPAHRSDTNRHTNRTDGTQIPSS